MSIASRQVKKEVNKIIENRMKEGYIPGIEYLISRLSVFYRRVRVGSPSFRMRKQGYRQLWDIDYYNANLDEIYDDVNILYEELISQFTVILDNFDYYDTERRKLMQQIKDLDGDLEDLLLVAADTEGYLYAVHDKFIDRSKIDMSYSTCEINTDAGVVTLRESRNQVKKIDMSHYFDTVNFPILSEEKYAKNIVSNRLMPQSKFGQAFSDINTSWIQNIVTTQPGELEVSFIIEVKPGSDFGEYISRLEFYGQTPNPMHVRPLWSFDNINFKNFAIGNGEEEKVVSDDKKTVWNFLETRARYIKFIMRKDMEDEVVGGSRDPRYRYLLGAKHIELFKMAYDKSSTLYSQAFEVEDPTGEQLTIDKAALIIDQDKQPGTDIEYYLSLGVEGVTDPTQFNWVAISPLNVDDPEEQQLINFRHVAFFTNIPDIEWDESTYGTPVETHNGISFYKMYEFPYEPVRDSVSLYRGKNNWQVFPQYKIKRKAVYDEKHLFGGGDIITLNYPDFTPVEGDGLIRGSVKLKSDPGQNPSYTYVQPSDFSVNYSNYIITKQTGSNISKYLEAPSNTAYADYEYDDEVAKPTIYTTFIYVSNPDGVDINIVPFTAAEREAGQFLTIDTKLGIIDLSTEAFFHIPPGWHKVSTTAEPQGEDDRFYSVNGNKYLYQKVYAMYAFAEKLQETSWFVLKHNTIKSDRSKYAVIDYDGDDTKEIIVNYKPQNSGWSSSNDDLLCPAGAETYVLSYKYISTITNKIYLKADLTRDENTAATATPTLRSYTIKLGY